MSVMVWLSWFVILALSMLLSAFFSGMEMGCYVINKVRLDLRAESGSRSAAALRKLLRRPNNLLAVLLIGNNIVNYLATFSASVIFLMAGLGPQSEWLTPAVMTPALFILSESVPKNVFQRLAEKLTYKLAWLLSAVSLALNASGLVMLVRAYSGLLMRLCRARRPHNPLGHEGLAAIVAEAQAGGVLTHFQTIMADRVMHLSEVTAEKVMIPMSRVVWADVDVSREQLIELMRTHNYSRLPLMQEGRVVGILNIYDVLIAAETQAPPKDKMAAPLVLARNTGVIDALYAMQQARATMAIIADAAGRHVGIATVKDLVEEVVGELEAW